MGTEKKCAKRSVIALPAILLISFAVWLAVSFAWHLACGGDLSWTYLIVKGILVSAGGAALYFFTGAKGEKLYETYRKPILYAGTVLLLVAAVLESPLSRVEMPVISRVVAYLYAARPFLEVVALCALAASLEKILSGSFGVSKIFDIAISALLVLVLGNVLKIAALVLLIVTLFRCTKAKKDADLISVIIASILGILLFAYLAYEWIEALKYLILEFYNKDYMSYLYRDVWAQVKLFGTMDDLGTVGGSTSYFSLIWMSGFLGLIPAALIVLVMAFLVAWMLKKRAGSASHGVRTLALIYFIVRALLAVLANFGVFFTGFMTPVPLLLDTVAGVFSSFWLFGLVRSK